MKTVYKYQLPFAPNEYGTTTIVVPKGFIILHADNQYDQLCIWVEVDTTTQETENLTIEVVGTGKPLSPNPKLYIGTVFVQEYVWHVYEVIT